MASENALNAMVPTNNWVWFDDPIASQNDLSSILNLGNSKSPKGCALTLIRSFAVTLQQHLSHIVQNAVVSHTDLLHKLMTKMDQLTKMGDNDDFIPHSARMVDFNFRVIEKVENSQEFLVIQADTYTLVQEFKLLLQHKIMETPQIEYK